MSKADEERRIKQLIASSEFLHEEDHRPLPWFKWLSMGIIGWLVIIGVTLMFNQP